jgi:hypothetical protein
MAKSFPSLAEAWLKQTSQKFHLLFDQLFHAVDGHDHAGGTNSGGPITEAVEAIAGGGLIDVLRLSPLAEAPATPTKWAIYLDAELGYRVFDGTEWRGIVLFVEEGGA